ncbi:DUF2407 C-terminal domain-containing protein [Corynascus similis CBS 632.67]
MSGARGGSSARASSSSSSSPTRAPRDRDSRPPPPRSPNALLFSPAPPPLHITIRFSIALPDIHIDIPLPQQTTVVALKHLVRDRLAADAKAEASSKDEDNEPDTQLLPAAQASLARLRFIHNGRILPDAAVLSAVLKAAPPPPLSHHADPKGKSPAGIHHQQQRVFINCSIGDPLPEADIAAEAAAAAAPITTSTSNSSAGGGGPGRRTPQLSVTTTNLDDDATGGADRPDRSSPQQHQQHHQQPTGFDRLLQAGLTPAEIATLRSHFRAIHTARFTPDTMPSPDTLRSMEDAWLDGSGGGGGIPTTTAGSSDGSYGAAGGETGEAGEGEGGMVDDAFGLSAVAGPLIQGMLIGFVFPLGVIGWLGKEDGVWSRRMQVFVVFGVLLSVSVGLVRGLTGEG